MTALMMEMEGPATPEEVVLIVHYLMGQGFVVQILSTDPLTLQLTCPEYESLHPGDRN